MIRVAHEKALLGDVAEIRSGIGFPLTFQGKETGDFPFAKVGDISNVARSGISFISDAPNWITKEELPQLKAKPFPTGTIVFAKIGEAISQNFRVVATRPMLFDNNVMGVVPNSTYVDTQYLLFYLKTLDFYPLAAKTTVPSIRKTTIEALSIPLPPLEEQRRIATILDRADAVRRKRQEAIRLTEELLRSLFLEMFGDPVTNLKGWQMVELGEILSIVSGQVDPQDAPYIDMPHIGGENIQANTGRINGVQTPREIGLQSGKYLFESTDVLYSKIRPYLNKVVIPGFIGVCSADIYPLRVDKAKVCPQYLVYLLRSNTFLEYAEKHSARTNIPKINRPALLKFSAPYPPLNLQKKFSAIYDKVCSTKNQIDQATEDGNKLFNSLLQRAFRGEL